MEVYPEYPTYMYLTWNTPADSKPLTRYDLVSWRWEGSEWTEPVITATDADKTEATLLNTVLTDKWYAYALRTVCAGGTMSATANATAVPAADSGSTQADEPALPVMP